MGRGPHTSARAVAGTVALARRGQPVDRIWICAARVFESDLVLADHADCGSDDWALVLVGEHDNGMGCPRHSSACRFDTRAETDLLSRRGSTWRDIWSGGDAHLRAIEVFQLRR